MSAIINVTPVLRFFDDLGGILRQCGYSSKVDSLHQVRANEDQWSLHLTVFPNKGTGKCARIALQLDNIAENGRTARVSLDHLKLEPKDSSEVRDLLRREIETNSTPCAKTIHTTLLSYIIADALDAAGVNVGLSKDKN